MEVPSTSSGEPDARVLLVIPTLGKRLDYLEETLESVVSQAVSVDLVAVLPADARGARELCSRYGAVLVDDPGSLSGAINAGIARASGNHVYGNWIGDDDLLAPGSLDATTRAMDDDPSAVVAYGYCTYIDESLRFAMDLDLLLRLRRRGKFVDVGRPVSSFRWHRLSLTVSDRTASLRESEAVKHRYLSRTGRRLAPLWDVPVRRATIVVARRMGARAAQAAR